MNELELVTLLRDEVPLAPASSAAERAFLDGIGRPAVPAADPDDVGRRVTRHPGAQNAPDGWRRRRSLRVAIAAGLALAAFAAGAVGVALSRTPTTLPRTIAWSGRPTAPPAFPVPASLGRARTEAQLVDDATRASALLPGRAPSAHEWVFVKTETASSSAGGGGFLFGPPNERVVGLQWIRVDWREFASGVNVPASLPPTSVVSTHLLLSTGHGGSLGGWKSVRYDYLKSLPRDPAALESVILADNVPGMPWYSPSRDRAIFNAIAVLLEGQTEGVWIPPQLAATMYRVLQQLPGVHFEAMTDLAGRAGLGLYMVDGWYKEELVINPSTYAFMGDKAVAIKTHRSVATDGTRLISKGQVLGWEALLESAIVQRPGQLP